MAEAMIGQPQKFVTMNPKAILSGQMFGTMDVAAGEWNDGIFSQLWRKANKDKKNFTWLVLDGPVDAIWIENMNTVMDDNKLLTLANNDRIPMLRPNVTLHFEVEDLRNASPATVSRAGIIYVSEADLGCMPFVTSWLASRSQGRQGSGADLHQIHQGVPRLCQDRVQFEDVHRRHLAVHLVRNAGRRAAQRLARAARRVGARALRALLDVHDHRRRPRVGRPRKGRQVSAHAHQQPARV